MIDNEILEELRHEASIWEERISDLKIELSKAQSKLSKIQRLIVILEEHGKIW